MQRCFIFLMAWLNLIEARQDVKTEDKIYNISVVVVDNNHPSKDRILAEVLELERSLVVPLDSKCPVEQMQNGCLLIQMTPEYIHNLLQQKKGRVFAAFQNETLVGYAVLDEISEFTTLFKDEQIGRVESSLDANALGELFSRPKIGYIEQIAVRSDCARMGVGSQLIRAIKEYKSDGLIVDVFIFPVVNEPSLHFFASHGFKQKGILHQAPRDDFPYPHRTQILLWDPFFAT